MITAVTPSAADDEARPVLAGALIESRVEENKGGELLLAAADGFRLAEAKWPMEIPAGMKAIHAILPAKALEKLVRMLEGEENVSIGTSEKGKVQFRHNGTTVSITPINGAFPDYQSIIPKQAPTIVSFGIASILDGLKSGRLIGLQGNFLMRPGEDGKGNVTLDVESETGHVENRIEALMKGEPQDICVNLQYLRDAIEGCATLGYDGVFVAPTGSSTAVLIKPPDEKDGKKPRAKFIVMPAMGKNRTKEEPAPAAEAAKPPVAG
jgi:DNA polymerase III sliding clamp (beta) subunit (PCNA family)